MNLELKDSVWIIFLKSQNIDPSEIFEEIEKDFLPYNESQFFDLFGKQILIMGKCTSIEYVIGNKEFSHKFDHPTPMISIGDFPSITIPCLISYRGLTDLDLYSDEQRKIVSGDYTYQDLFDSDILDPEGTIEGNEYFPPGHQEETTEPEEEPEEELEEEPEEEPVEIEFTPEEQKNKAKRKPRKSTVKSTKKK